MRMHPRGRAMGQGFGIYEEHPRQRCGLVVFVVYYWSDSLAGEKKLYGSIGYE